MDYNTFVEMVNGQEKLSFSDAKRMYIEASKETDEKKKKEMLDKIVLGTLYYPLSRIDELENIQSASFDKDDLANSFCEEWIKQIYNGAIENKTSFIQLIGPKFRNSIYTNTYGEREDITLSTIPLALFEKLLMKYIQLRNNEINIKEIGYNELLEIYTPATNHKFIPDEVLEALENIYASLLDEETNTVDIKPTKIKDYLKFYLENGIFEELKDDTKKYIHKKFEDSYLDYLSIKDIIDEVTTEKQKEYLNLFFGFVDGKTYTFKEIGEICNVNSERVRQMIALALRKIRTRMSRNDYLEEEKINSRNK